MTRAGPPPSGRRSSVRRPIPQEEKKLLYYDVASMYHRQGLTQGEIARRVGVTRSMISRMLTEAQRRGIIEIRLNVPRLRDVELEDALTHEFKLKAVTVVHAAQGEAADDLRRRVGAGGARLLEDYLAANIVLGAGWGTSVGSVVEELQLKEPLSATVVQLVAALGARTLDYDGRALVQRLVDKLGGEGFFLHAPFRVEDAAIVRELLANPSVRETVELFRQCQVALTGIGSTDPRYSSYLHAGYVPIGDLERLRAAGIVGDVCGRHFDLKGNEAVPDFDAQVVAITRKDLLAIPTRIGVASGPAKAEPILGAARGGLINAVVTDSRTAARVLSLVNGRR